MQATVLGSKPDHGLANIFTCALGGNFSEAGPEGSLYVISSTCNMLQEAQGLRYQRPAVSNLPCPLLEQTAQQNRSQALAASFPGLAVAASKKRWARSDIFTHVIPRFQNQRID